MAERRGEGFAGKIASPMENFSPAALTVSSVVLAGLGGLSYYLSGYFLLLAFITILFSAYFDAADGHAARHQGIASRKGDLLDHFGDRYSDIMLVAGMGLSVYGNSLLALGAVAGVMMTSYMGTQAQALGLERDYAGPLGRSYRLVIIILACLLQFVLPYSYTFILKLNVTTVVLIWFMIGGIITSLYRFGRAYRKL
ncbi:MAG: CDP-alcohol phosphatidyltransferase family protein [Candidatus Thermoplasmatota archaeon]|nr:CDP-alcohol phosphatidyltransferase family protein [Candidatus Thermoplasmatota archaeon]